MTSFLDRQLTSQPLHLPRDRGGLGDWRWMPRFRTTTWQVPGSMGFVGSERETKHHLWNCNLIDCCSHYPVEFLKLLRAWARKSQGDTERKRWGEAGREKKKIRSSWSSAVQSPWSPLQLSCSREAGRQQGEEKEPRDPHLKNHSLWCFSPCSLHTRIQSEPPLCMVLKLDYEVANAFSAADKRSGFSSRGRKFVKNPPLTLATSPLRGSSTRWETLICSETHTSHLRWRVFYSCPSLVKSHFPAV